MLLKLNKLKEEIKLILLIMGMLKKLKKYKYR